MEPLALTACELTWCRPQTLGPATMAPYPSPTQYNHQLLTAHGTTTCETKPPTCETINPHTTRGLTLSGEPSTTSGATSPHWTNGNTTTVAASVCRVYMSIHFEHILCCIPRHVQSNFIWGGHEAILLVVNIVTSPIGTDCGGTAPVVGLYRVIQKSRKMFELQ